MADSSLSAPPLRGANLPDRRISSGGIQFRTRQAYHAWAGVVDDEAPGLAGRLITLYRVDGSCRVLFKLRDETPLLADGLDVLHDINRRLGLGTRRKRPPHKSCGGHPRPGDRRNSRYSLPVSTRSLPPCQLLA